jgi:hypothetical protein
MFVERWWCLHYYIIADFAICQVTYFERTQLSNQVNKHITMSKKVCFNLPFRGLTILPEDSTGAAATVAEGWTPSSTGSFCHAVCNLAYQWGLHHFLFLFRGKGADGPNFFSGCQQVNPELSPSLLPAREEGHQTEGEASFDKKWQEIHSLMLWTARQGQGLEA